MIPLSRSLVEKARGCDIDFLRCSFRLFLFKPHDGEMPSPKIGSFPGFFERSIRPEPPAALARIRIDLQLRVVAAEGRRTDDSPYDSTTRVRGLPISFGVKPQVSHTVALAPPVPAFRLAALANEVFETWAFPSLSAPFHQGRIARPPPLRCN